MKKIILCTFVLAVAIQGLRAQEMPERKRETINNRHHSDGFNRLDLSEEQKAKFKSMNEDFRKQMQDLKKQDDITVKEWKGRMQKLRTDHKEKMQGPQSKYRTINIRNSNRPINKIGIPTSDFRNPKSNYPS